MAHLRVFPTRPEPVRVQEVHNEPPKEVLWAGGGPEWQCSWFK